VQQQSTANEKKHGWRKPHISVNEGGEIVAQVLTDGNVDDARTVVELIEQVGDDLKDFIGDAAYAPAAIYHAAGVRGGTVIVPPVKGAIVARSKLPLSALDKTVLKVKAMVRKEWKKQSRYHRQGRVENTFFRYKQIFAGKLIARHAQAQQVEAALACRIPNRMGGDGHAGVSCYSCLSNAG
jgi:hypothetical protein